MPSSSAIVAYDERNRKELASFHGQFQEAREEILVMRGKTAIEAMIADAEAVANVQAVKRATERDIFVHDEAIKLLDRLAATDEQASAPRASKLIELLGLQRQRHRVNSRMAAIDPRCRCAFNERLASIVRNSLPNGRTAEMEAAVEAVIKNANRQRAAIEAKLGPLQEELTAIDRKIGEIMESPLKP